MLEFNLINTVLFAFGVITFIFREDIKCLLFRFIFKKNEYSEIRVVHKTPNFIVVNKQFDLKINSNNENETTIQTLLKKKYPLLANSSLVHEFYFPHRLDYATSGLLCIPLHKKACIAVSDAFHTRQIKKYYIAIIRGLTSKEAIEINLPIGEDKREKSIQKMCTSSVFCKKPRDAKTVILVLETGTYDGFPATKILARLVTGRRHQIRVHCSSLGHTIVGDYTYSDRKDVEPSRMYLHAVRIVVPNAVEYLDVETKDPFVNCDKWNCVNTINDLKTAYYKLDQFLNVLN